MSKFKQFRFRRTDMKLHGHWGFTEVNDDGVPFVDKTTGLKRKVNARNHKFTVSNTYNNDFAGGPKTSSKSYSVSLRDDVTYGHNIPGWRDKLRTGVGVVTSLSGTRQTLKVDFGGNCSNYFPPRPKTVYGVTTGPVGITNFIMPSADTVTSTTADNQARKKLLASYLKQVQSFSGGKFLAEIKDTIELVLHPVHSIYKATFEYAGVVKKLGKVYQHKPRTLAHALSESWLAYSFGIKPAVQDANDAVSAFNSITQSQRHDIRYVRGSGLERGGSYSHTLETFDGSTTVWMSTNNRIEKSVRLLGAFRQAPVGTSNLLDEFGLNLADIAPSIWEGIPWSFFVDYFTNVGDCLDAWRYIGVDQAWLIRTVRNRVTRTSSAETNYVTPPTERQNIVRGSGTVIGTTTFVQRTPTSFFSETPTFHFKLPGNDPRRLLNITALIGVINDSRPKG